MKNTFRSILTMLLVLVMVFGVVAPTVTYAADIPTLPDGTVPTLPSDAGIDTGWLKVEHGDDYVTVTLYPEVDELLDVTKQEIKDIASAILDCLWEIALGQLKYDIADATGVHIDNEDLIHHITEVYIDGTQVFGPFGDNGDNVLLAEEIKDILLDLPRPHEIAEMADDEMKLSYEVEMATDYGNYSFTLNGVIGGGYDKIRKIAEIVTDYVDFHVATDGTYVIDVTVPAAFHKAVLKACEGDQLTDELKLKVFEALSKTVNDFEVYYKNFTFGELIELMEAVDFEGILSAEAIKKYVDLSGYTNEQIIAKVKEYEGLFNTAKNYAARLFDLIPAAWDSKTLLDLYDGNGEFSYVGNNKVDVEEVLTTLSAQYGPLLASFINKDEIALNLDVSVSVKDIYSVQYVVNGAVLSEGFLPSGLEYEHIEFFAPVKDVDGKAVVAWVDEQGSVITEMPARDIVLTAVIDKDFDITVSGDVDKVYDGQVSTGLVVGGSTTATYTYEWYRVDPNGDVKLGITTPDISFVNAADSGEYYCVVTVTEGIITKTITSDVITVNIAKKVISAADVVWSTTTEFVYDGTEKSVTASGIDNVEFVYADNVATNAGDYTAKITAVNLLSGFDSANCELDPTIVGLTKDWKIAPKTVDVSGAEWDYSGTAFEHDGNAHGVALKPGSYPTEGVTLTYGGTYTATDKGDYVATATFTPVNGNYVVSGSVDDCAWSIVISIIQVDVSGLVWDYTAPFTYNGNEFTVALKNVPTGVSATYTGNKGTNAGTYTAKVTFTAEAGYEVVGSVADLTWVVSPASVPLAGLTWSTETQFTYNGTEQGVTLTVPADVAELINVTVSGNKGTNAGNYTATATVTAKDATNYVLDGSVADCAWSIAKKAVDLTNVTWADLSFVYNGSAQGLTLALPTDVPACLKVTYEYTQGGNAVEPVNAGKYVAKVINIELDTQDPDAANYELIQPADLPEIEYEIAKADYVLSGITFTDKVVAFDRNNHSLTIEGTLPEFITVSYDGGDFYFIGSYTVVASFKVNNPNYNDNLADMTATLTITLVTQNEHEYKDSEGNVIVKVSSTKVPADHDFVVNDNSAIYTNVTLPNGENGVVVAAYDIYFAKQGTHMPISDNFTVSIRVPEAYRTGKTLTVVYIDGEGNVEEREATVNGEFITFTTEHFSTYAVVSVEAPPAPAPERNLTWLWILLAIIIIALLVVIIILLIRRRKDDDDGEPTEEPVTEPEGEPEPEPATEEPAEEPVAEPVTEEPIFEEPADFVMPDAPEIPADYEPAEEPVAEPAKPTVIVAPLSEADEDGTRHAIIDGEIVYVRYRSSFESRLIQSDSEIQDYYTVIKNTLLSYKGVKARTSWNFESFNKTRVQCAKLNVKGRALLVYLALDPKEYSESKYHFTDASDKPKFEAVPMLLKVKSDRSLKYALELIEEMMAKLEIPQVDMPGVDYHMPYETTDALAKRGLVKVILPPGMTLDENSNIVRVNVGELLEGYESKEKTEDTPAVEPAVEPVVEPVAEPVVEEPVVEEPVVEPAPVVTEPVHVDAVTADEMLTDEEAEAKIEVVHSEVKHTGKLVEINLDIICENYEDGETVDIDNLKTKRLINKNAGRIKVLARGTMTKKLKIKADKFSLQAVKMITLAGGVAEIED